jgi:hypothetical protein
LNGGIHSIPDCSILASENPVRYHPSFHELPIFNFFGATSSIEKWRNAMRIFGLDFTSRPTPKKPITCSVCELENNKLWVLSFLSIPGFNSFESFCEAEGAWVTGMDFPFGMPRKLIDHLQYPHAWERYVAKFGSLTRQNFIDLLTDYKSKQPKGAKEHRRMILLLIQAVLLALSRTAKWAIVWLPLDQI